MKRLLVMLMMGMFLLSFTSADLQNGLISHWGFEDSSGNIQDSTDNNNDLTVYGSPSQYQEGGKIGYSLGFDGANDYLESTSTNLQGDYYTLIHWIKSDDATWDDYSEVGPSYYPGLRSWFPSGVNDVGGHVGVDGTPGGNLDFDMADAGTITNWHFVAITYDGTTAKLYIDGISVENNTEISGALTYASNEFLVGTQIGYKGTRVLDGNIDELAVWNRSLTQHEIGQMYNGGNGLEYPFEFSVTTIVVYPVNLSTYNVGDVTTLTYVTDGDDSAWYSIDGGTTNSSYVSAGTNFTGLSAGVGWNNWTLFVNSTSGAESRNDFAFYVSSAIDTTVTNPITGSFSNVASTTLQCYGNNKNGDGVTTLKMWLDGSLFTSTTNSSINENLTISTSSNLAEGSHTVFCEAISLDENSVNSTTVTHTKDFTAPTVIEYAPNGSATYMEILRGEVIFNWSASDTYLDNCWYNYNGTNISLACTNHTNLPSQYSNLTFYANDSAGNLLAQLVEWTIIDSSFTFYVWDYLGELISSITVNGDIDYNGNPFSSLVSNFLDDITNATNISLSIVDLGNRNQDLNTTFEVNTTFEEYNITMSPNQLYLSFYNNESNLTDTKFEIYDKDKLFANSSSSVVIVQSNLTLGNVYVRFNEDDYGVNWTQFYEYTNDFETHVSEDLTIIENADWTAYFEIKSKDGRPIENAYVRAEFSDAIEGEWTGSSLIGQRLTQSDGTTFFRFDSATYVTVYVTAEGYDAKEISFVIGDESATSKSFALPIYMDESDSGVSNNVWVYYPKKVRDLSQNIEGIIIAKSVDQVKINTAYRVALGLSDRELLDTGRGKYNSSLISGTDFDASGSDVTVYIYIDNELVKTWVIEETTPTTIFDGFGSLNSDVLLPVGAIALVFVSGIVGGLFTSTTAGFSAFMVGSVLMSLISIEFLFLSIISMVYFLLKAMKRVTSE